MTRQDLIDALTMERFGHARELETERPDTPAQREARRQTLDKTPDPITTTTERTAR